VCLSRFICSVVPSVAHPSQRKDLALPVDDYPTYKSPRLGAAPRAWRASCRLSLCHSLLSVTQSQCPSTLSVALPPV
jgi:hypothetical protein